MKLKNGFVPHKSNGEYVIVATGDAAEEFNGLVRLNEVSYFIACCLKNDTDENEILKAVCDRYDVSKDRAAADINGLIMNLKESGLIEG